MSDETPDFTLSTQPSITVLPDAALMVSNARLVNRTPVHTQAGEPVAWITGASVPTEQQYWLCRCGQSANKPFCDGTHQSAGFDGTEAASDERIAAAWKDHTGPAMTVHDNRSVCVHAMN